VNNIKTWKQRLQADYPDMDLSDLIDRDDRRKFAEISDLRASLEKAEGERNELSKERDSLLIHAYDLKARLATLEGSAPLTSGYVQSVPDKCDRITWRNRYYHLPIDAAAGAAPAQGEVVVTKNEAGQIVSVTRQDSEGKILKVIAASSSAAPVPEVVIDAIRSCEIGGYVDIDGDFYKTWHFDEALVEQALGLLN